MPSTTKVNLDPSMDTWLWTAISWHHQCILALYLCGIFCVGMLIVGKTKLIRTLRSTTGPMIVFFLGYRIVSLCLGKGVENNVLSIIAALTTSTLESMQKYQVTMTAFVGDIVGIIIIFAVMKAITDLGNLKYTVIKKQMLATVYDSIKWLPMVQKEIKKEQTKLEEHFEDHLKKKSRAIGLRYPTLPPKGIDKRGILGLMRDVTGQEDQIWQAGKVSGAIYHGGSDHIDFLNSAFGCYSIANPLHPDIWPSGMKFEAEIISMATALVNGRYHHSNDSHTSSDLKKAETNMSSICGCTTSGGTESIVLAIKAHRDYYTHRHNIARPEMIACVSAHAAVDKACDMLGITLIKVPMCPITCRISLPAVHAAVGANTIMLYGSAPSFPQGAIDPISDLAAIALEHDIGLHVDCCLGGFVLPFAKKLGYPIPSFDFGCKGVTSMSMDTHKYGYALKGTSVLLYAHKALRHAQYFCYADWTGGLYTTPTIAGSRSGGLIAQCWASMIAIGEEGYLKHTKDILETTVAIAKGVAGIPGLRLLGGSDDGTPDAMIVCFASAPWTSTVRETTTTTSMTVTVTINIYAISDAMSKKGWSLNPLQHPACIHLCVTLRHVGKVDVFLQDLKACVTEVGVTAAASQVAQMNGGPKIKEEGNAAIYGMTSSLPPGPVNDLLKTYNDVIFKV